MNDQDELLKVLKSIDFWLGAIASSGQRLVQMEAMKQGIPCKWHDPTIEPWPTKAKHGETAELREILIGVPKHQRAKAD